MQTTTNRKINFTDRTLKALKPPATMAAHGIEYTDTEVGGLKLTVGQSGSKHFSYRFKLDGRSGFIAIGRFPDTGAAEARARARDYRAMVDRGEDPRAERQRRREMPTLAEFVNDQYLPWARKTKRSVANDESKFTHHLLPKFGRYRLDALGRRDIEMYLADLKGKPGKTTGKPLAVATINRHLTLLSAVYREAVNWELVERNPCAGIRQAKENNARQRFLSEIEVRRLFDAMEAYGRPVAAAAVKLLLLTGVRRSEALGARWKDVDLAHGLWFLPETKSGRARNVQLSDPAVALLKAQASRGESEWVFPGRDGKPLKDLRKTLAALLKAAGIDEHTRVHDLRHSFASMAVNAGVSLFTVQQLLGHASPKMTQRYAHLQDATVRQAAQAVGRVVTAAVEESVEALAA